MPITQTGNKATGKNAIIKWGTDIFACLTAIALQGNGQSSSETCSSDGTGNAVVHRDVGAAEWEPTTTLLMDKDEETLPNALLPGKTDSLECYPFGDEIGMVFYTWQVATVLNHGVGSGTTDYGKLDISWAPVGDPTIAVVLTP